MNSEKWLESQMKCLASQLEDAHKRIKWHERDKAILAKKLLVSEEERKRFHRQILEMKAIMDGDALHKKALTERNKILQAEVNRFRKLRLLTMSYEPEPELTFSSCYPFKAERNEEVERQDLSAFERFRELISGENGTKETELNEDDDHDDQRSRDRNDENEDDLSISTSEKVGEWLKTVSGELETETHQNDLREDQAPDQELGDDDDETQSLGLNETKDDCEVQEELLPTSAPVTLQNSPRVECQEKTSFPKQPRRIRKSHKSRKNPEGVLPGIRRKHLIVDLPIDTGPLQDPAEICYRSS